MTSDDAVNERDVPLDVVGLAERGLRGRFGSDLVLVRPDQHVAWLDDGSPADPGTLVDRTHGALGAPALR